VKAAVRAVKARRHLPRRVINCHIPQDEGLAAATAPEYIRPDSIMEVISI
jgi:hypothetical protein